jgi:hypothetical protein
MLRLSGTSLLLGSASLALSGCGDGQDSFVAEGSSGTSTNLPAQAPGRILFAGFATGPNDDAFIPLILSVKTSDIQQLNSELLALQASSGINSKSFSAASDAERQAYEDGLPAVAPLIQGLFLKESLGDIQPASRRQQLLADFIAQVAKPRFGEGPVTVQAPLNREVEVELRQQALGGAADLSDSSRGSLASGPGGVNLAVIFLYNYFMEKIDNFIREIESASNILNDTFGSTMVRKDAPSDELIWIGPA